MKYIDGGVCAAKGFKATGLNAGIKNNVKKDMALVFSEAPYRLLKKQYPCTCFIVTVNGVNSNVSTSYHHGNFTCTLPQQERCMKNGNEV